MDAVEARLGIAFKDRDLLRTALTHPSYSFEAGTREQYERLEFLGDAVLGFLVTDHLYAHFPRLPEGRLAKLRAALVSGRTLADVARGLGLGDALLVGRGADVTGARGLASVLADAFEALVGAAYLDRGLEETRALVLGLFADRLTPEALADAVDDPKSELQERTMARGAGVPEYRIVCEQGPPHERTFTAEVLLDGRALGRGEGGSKKEAEKGAAADALASVEELAARPGSDDSAL